MANVLKTYRDLKSKHPDALLLFRCGDFYETYEQDAKVVSEVLGITLTFRDLGEHIDMAGFPHHALDTYLPKIIRAGHRVAICDMPEPTTKLVRRGSDELTTTATTNNKNSNNSKLQDNMKLNINNQNESANKVNNAIAPIKVGEYTVKDDNGKDVTFESVIPAAIGEPVDADFEEVKDEPKKKVTLKRKVTIKRKKTEPKSDEPKAEVSAVSAISACQYPTVQFSTYTTKRGDTAPQIIGFGGEDDPRWKSHKDAGHKYVSASYRRDLNGNKVYILLFGVRYMDVAKALCGAYNTPDVNAWHRAEDACMAIYEQAQRDGKAKWEAKKAQWAEKKNEERRMKNEESRAAERAEKQVAAMLEKLMKGEDVPESILKHIDPEVLAKFTKAA